MKVHILDDWLDRLRGLPGFDKLRGHDVTVWTDHEPDPTGPAARVKEAVALVLFRERSAVGQDLLSRLPNLRLISQRGACPHVDIAACSDHGVMLCSNPAGGGPNYAAAELTLALILASFRQIPQQVASIRRGAWQMGVGHTLRGQTLGLYGYGKIAKAVASYASALGVAVQVWGSEEGRARALADGLSVPESRRAFFATSGSVSLHVRLTAQTRGVITAQDLAAMPPRSLLVNTARTGLIAPGALKAEIAKGRLHAALEVFENALLRDPGHILLTHPNVLPTPHIGFVTEDEFDHQFGDILDQVNALAAGAPIDVINPEVSG